MSYLRIQDSPEGEPTDTSPCSLVPFLSEPNMLGGLHCSVGSVYGPVAGGRGTLPCPTCGFQIEHNALSTRDSGHDLLSF